MTVLFCPQVQNIYETRIIHDIHVPYVGVKGRVYEYSELETQR